MAAGPPPVSGVGVLDKVSIILSLIEQRPTGLPELVKRSGLPRPTVHRLAVAMERLDLLTRDVHGSYAPGPRLERFSAEAQHDQMVHAAEEILAGLAERTSFSTRLHHLHKGVHLCVASSTDPDTGVETLPIGTTRPVKAGPIGQVLLAWESPEELCEGLRGARFTAQQLTLVRKAGWAYGSDDAIPGHAVFVVPVGNGNGRVIAALMISGPRARLPEVPDRLLRAEVIDAAVDMGMASQARALRPAPG
ncbi:IclR family transcriptional regulator [Streptomyces halobius]|uniref:Helix-turn-helix domain-containing protein n=1 Tax=Streptomyces halobius TaxID=2879846 RepID=A0ABY4MID7_9ACTN|nr:IclR family transcriptional regulator C-terminal domain-containing protein [Streptomyces halobius]UQA97579.1 helix-turn-helix domain-containing protein [Streptomyces halobius]